MKQIIFYILLTIQLLFLGILIYQFEQIERVGKEIVVVTKDDGLDFNMYIDNSNDYPIRVTYNINEIDEEYLPSGKHFTYNDPLFVTLTQDEQLIVSVKHVSLKKPTNMETNDIVVKANYMYETEYGSHYIEYGFEWLERLSNYEQFSGGSKLQVTVLLGKWGQQHIKDVVTLEK